MDYKALQNKRYQRNGSEGVEGQHVNRQTKQWNGSDGLFASYGCASKECNAGRTENRQGEIRVFPARNQRTLSLHG